ncbi:MAG: hypothetical protein M3Z14_03045 [Candidatus Eremiobacteraeota bacterium]|nr:hypothetical protein [Candidatus Eremiobacteraeota bacterium]
MNAILGIDPGTRKAGFAILADRESLPLTFGVEQLGELVPRLRTIVPWHRVRAIALGKGTHASELMRQLAVFGLPIHLIDERGTTLNARALYFADHPPRGWRRFVPLGMQLPPRPIDDYAAILIARRFLELEALPAAGK